MKIGDLVYIAYEPNHWLNSGNAHYAKITGEIVERRYGGKLTKVCQIEVLQSYDFEKGWHEARGLGTKNVKKFLTRLDNIHLDATSALAVLLKGKEADLIYRKRGIEQCKEAIEKARKDLKYCQTKFRELKRLDVSKQFLARTLSEVSKQDIVPVNDGFYQKYSLPKVDNA